jgi:hypothetical protein
MRFTAALLCGLAVTALGVSYDVHTPPPSLLDASSGSSHPSQRLLDATQPSGNITRTPKDITVLGIGVFVIDIASIDLRAGTFFADLQLFALRYHVKFENASIARQTAMDENRACLNPHDFLFQNITREEAGDQLNVLNVGKFPSIIPIMDPSGVSADHVRVKSEVSAGVDLLIRVQDVLFLLLLLLLFCTV